MAGGEMERADWTPAVLITATVSLTVVVMVWLARDFLRPAPDARPGPARELRTAPHDLAVWVGEPLPGLKVALAPVNGVTEADLFHDRELNEGLCLVGPGALAYYRLLLFNSSAEERTVDLVDGAISVRPADGGAPVAFRSLPALVERGVAKVSPALRRVLEGLGTLRQTVRLEPGSSAALVVPFEQRVDLASAQGVTMADGTALHARRIGRGALERLIASPDEQQVEDL